MKKILFHISYFFSVIAVVTSTRGGVTEDSKRYKIVSENLTAREFYPEIRSRKPTRNEANLNSFSKNQICRDIISSHYIGTRLGYYLHEKSSCLCAARRADEHPSKQIEVFANIGGTGEPYREWAFACRVRRKFSGRKTKKFYVSEEYNIGSESGDYLAGRFVFQFFGNSIHLDGLAEPTAKVLTDTHNYIERIYLKRIEGREPAPTSFDDPLCSLDFVNKIRICTAVFSSEYFENTLYYPASEINWVSGSCEKRTVLFRTNIGRRRAGRRHHEEWLMSCKTTDDEEHGNFNYFISHAYKSNEIFIYFWESDEEIFLENIATNVRFSFEIVNS